MKFITYSREMGMAVGRWRYSEYITSYIILTCGIMLIFLECAVGLTHWVNTWRIMGAKNSEHTRACILVSKHHSPVKRTGLLGDMANSTSQEGRDNMSLVHISCGVRKQVSGQHHLNQWSNLASPIMGQKYSKFPVEPETVTASCLLYSCHKCSPWL